MEALGLAQAEGAEWLRCFIILWKLCACLSLFQSWCLLCCRLSLGESSGTLVYFKWKPYFNKFLFSGVCRFFSAFVELHISFLSKATQSAVSGSEGLRLCVPPVQASLVLNITNKDDNNTAFSQPLKGANSHPSGGGGELWLSRVEWRQSAVTDHCWLCISDSACEWGEGCVRLFNLSHVAVTVVESVHDLDALLKGWREGYFTNDPLWKIVRAARSRINWCLIIHWEIMNVLNHSVCRSLSKLFKNKLKHRFHILKKCWQEYLTDS